MSFEWHKIDIGTIIGGVAPDGSPLLKHFLLDYKNEFNVEVVNASCHKCILSYQNEFIKKYGDMENTSQYRLHKKREGLQLEFGSSIFVTNKNITDDYAEKLIKRFSTLKADFKLDDLFSHYPKTEIKEIEVISETIEATEEVVTEKKPRKKRK